MKAAGLKRVGAVLAAVLVAISGLVAGLPSTATAQRSGAAEMPSFPSEEALREFLAPGGRLEVNAVVPPPPPPPPAPPPPPGAMPAPSAEPQASVVVSASRGDDAASITNTQITGVDEGGIVKVSGDYLIILRRGRLFTVSTADGELRAVASINAYPPGVNAARDWYDEMLVSGDLIVVIGYSYARGGTEINRFRLAADGTLSFVDAHHLRSDDYFSSRNYASRLVGEQLVVYAPLYFRWNMDDPLDALPAVSRWQAGQDEASFRRTASARNVYIPAPMRAQGPAAIRAMHSVTRCDLAAPELNCTSSVVLGPDGRTFFVSQNAVYVWVSPEQTHEDHSGPSYLYRMPLDGGAPSAVQVQGGPLDQFSFNANLAESRLEILVTDEYRGDAMWQSEATQGKPALLRLPTSRFGDGSGAAPASDYQFLPGDEYAYLDRNRFIGDRLLYALSRWEDGKNRYSLVVVPTQGGQPVELAVPEGIDRIEQLGLDAVVVGGDETALFLTIDVTASPPAIIDRYAERGAREAESRSHAFFYRPDAASGDGSDGLLGLPVINSAAGVASADMLFLRRASRQLSGYGRLESDPSTRADDGCVASCIDWYGNARPIFLRGRVFALMGYELVEGDASAERIRETRRISFAPQPRARTKAQ